MLLLYLGVDVAGAANTWVARLVVQNGALSLERAPQLMTLSEIAQLAEDRDVVAVAIDGQLSLAISDDNGFRSSDTELRRLLPPQCRNWVASSNSLMAVPIRTRILSEALSPSVATVIETHPRACLHFALTPALDVAIDGYKDKKNGNAPAYANQLWDAWSSRFGIGSALGNLSDGALDAAVCATIAYLYHHQRSDLLRLRHAAPCKTGRGPFFVLSP